MAVAVSNIGSVANSIIIQGAKTFFRQRPVKAFNTPQEKPLTMPCNRDLHCPLLAPWNRPLLNWSRDCRYRWSGVST